MAEQEQTQLVETIENATKYCPICGDTMHERTIRNYPYWECDDADCGFIEPKK